MKQSLNLQVCNDIFHLLSKEDDHVNAFVTHAEEAENTALNKYLSCKNDSLHIFLNPNCLKI